MFAPNAAVPNSHPIVRAATEPILQTICFFHMLSTNRRLKAFLNAALACLVVFIAIEVAIEAIVKRLRLSPARIENKAAPLPPAALRTK